MKPTTNGNDLYQLGNDYPQTSAYYVATSYVDGIYTETTVPVSSISGYNKRILNVLPQSGWDMTETSAIYSTDYATASVENFDLQ